MSNDADKAWLESAESAHVPAEAAAAPASPQELLTRLVSGLHFNRAEVEQLERIIEMYRQSDRAKIAERDQELAALDQRHGALKVAAAAEQLAHSYTRAKLLNTRAAGEAGKAIGGVIIQESYAALRLKHEALKTKLRE